jgi:flagellar hook assembly protein FlgD
LVTIDVSVNSDKNYPDTYSLSNSYPNPFNPTTHFQYGLPEQSDVRVVIYDVVGRQIKHWTMQGQKAGWYEIIWDGTNSQNQKVSTGIYIYQMRAGEFVETKKMVFMK